MIDRRRFLDGDCGVQLRRPGCTSRKRWDGPCIPVLCSAADTCFLTYKYLIVNIPILLLNASPRESLSELIFRYHDAGIGSLGWATWAARAAFAIPGKGIDPSQAIGLPPDPRYC